jgi:hypothetical protein
MSQYDTAQRPPISHGIKSWYVELHATGFADCHDRKYIVYVRCACGESLSQVCDRIADDGWNEACAIIWQHEQGIGKPKAQVEQTIVAPTPTPASVTATWADVFDFDPARNASYARLEAALDAQLKALR